jgi:GDP-L-fucose synthase
MPTNLYGPGDNYHLQNAHVLPALLRKFHEAKLKGDGSVMIWGTGKARREFLHVDDVAKACYYLMQKYESSEIINIGSGEDNTIRELAEMLKKVTGFTGKLIFDENKPDGTPRKLLNVDKINKLGWKHSISLADGLRSTYKDFEANYLYYYHQKDRRYLEMAHV